MSLGQGPGQEGQPLSQRRRRWGSCLPSTRPGSHTNGSLRSTSLPGAPTNRSSPQVSRSAASGLDCEGLGTDGQEWAQPGTEETHRRAPGDTAQCVPGPVCTRSCVQVSARTSGAEGARLPCAGRLLRTSTLHGGVRRLRRARSALCDLKTPRTGCWSVASLAGGTSKVRSSPWLMQGRGTHLRSAVKGTWPQTRHEQRPQAGVCPSVRL